MTETMQRIVLASRPDAKPEPANFRLEEVPMPIPGEGEFLARTIWLSLDPYMRGRMSAAKSYAKPVEIGETMTAQVVAEVVASHHPDYAPGDIVIAPFGWASHGISDGTMIEKIDGDAAPLSAYLGVLGMPGTTAWVGLNDIAAAQPGETIVVSAATGAVGSLVGQLAKLKGMRVIGVAGGAEKCAYAVEELGFDTCLDHRALDKAELTEAIAKAAPDGVHVYFENVGGKTLEATLPNMRDFGRIAICGMIAWYSGADNPAPAPVVWGAILRQKLRVQGFIVFDHWNRRPAFLEEVAPLVKAGKITFRETVEDGLQNAPAAFLRLLEGGNFGKQLVRVGADPA
ncbi:NADP-dependent oxidoreductase [Acidimangrovimonas sediminis]|uniref:NADP-dependent oxidoreductase n=1 Tax=Acidimangrovimonas sediminis TaxID=2056283 RepID=UPI000C7F7B48|nr:NADP-dependent oxidoreductase [Acidimangrovimonas sediminis]